MTVTGLRAYLASVGDMLSRDGRGDEVYAAAFARKYDRQTGQIMPEFLGFPERAAKYQMFIQVERMP